MGQVCEWAIVRFADGWSVVAGDRRFGRFDYRVDAEEEALRLAAAARQRGEEIVVLVQDANSQMHVLDQGQAPRPAA